MSGAREFGTHKDIKKAIRRAKRQGWLVETNGENHIKVTPPNGETFTIPMTFGSQRRIRNAVAQFKRAGLS